MWNRCFFYTFLTSSPFAQHRFQILLVPPGEQNRYKEKMYLNRRAYYNVINAYLTNKIFNDNTVIIHNMSIKRIVSCQWGPFLPKSTLLFRKPENLLH